jgi:regulator of protease activity HflC (stomatin/prohibitin superfamily)
LNWFWKLEPRDRAENLFSFVIAGATTAYVVIAAFQLCALNKTIKQTQKAVIAANAQASAAREANQIASEALKKNERAWVGLGDIDRFKSLIPPMPSKFA